MFACLRQLRPYPLSLLLFALLPAACTSGNDSIDSKGETFSAVAPDEVVTLIGNEPFWNLKVETDKAVWTTPDNSGGTPFAFTRFAGNNGMGFTGTIDGTAITATMTPGQCSDGMSDRTYPYVATIALGEATLRGCGYTDRQPYTGDAAP